jgi:site-specific DNA-methyltransferase (adenine-specific)
MNRIVNGDILRFAAHYRGARFHAVLCDPPYELGFMGKSWDSRGVSFRAETWAAIGSLLAPGAHLLAFGGTRTFHRIAVAIEDAGFEIRDTIGWMYGSGFPKSHNLDGAWQGYGTALKPAWEPVIVARKPLVGTVANNCLAHGCGAINVDGARVEYASDQDKQSALAGDAFKRKNLSDAGWSRPWMNDAEKISRMNADAKERAQNGRWPANIIHDGSDETAEVLGDAARFFYTAKASSREREEGLEGFDERRAGAMEGNAGISGQRTAGDGITPVAPSFRRNHHPTVKPLALTQYLATLILPPPHVESRILVPFAGSGSECIGAALAGWHTVVGVEREAEYAAIARARLEHWTKPLPD